MQNIAIILYTDIIFLLYFIRLYSQINKHLLWNQINFQIKVGIYCDIICKMTRIHIIQFEPIIYADDIIYYQSKKSLLFTFYIYIKSHNLCL